MPILIFIVVLGILVFVHELGHFWVARRSGIGVREFGFGFPPRLWGVQRREVLYSVNAIPFGGFVRLVGEGEGEEHAPDSFLKASIGKRVLVLFAGVGMNLILAWVLMSLVLGLGIRVDRASIQSPAGQTLQHLEVQSFVSAGSQAATAGLKSGDIIITINQRHFHSTEELIAFTKDRNYPSLDIVVDRSGDRRLVQVTPKNNRASNQPVYGFGIQESGILRYPVWQAPIAGLRNTAVFTVETVKALGTFFHDLVVHGKVADDVAGPVGIAVLTSEVSRLGFTPLLQFMAILSISLAVMNALPIPALDGGRVLFTLIEAVRRKPVNARIERAIHSVGFMALLLLILLISVRDVQRFNILSRITHLFQ